MVFQNTVDSFMASGGADRRSIWHHAGVQVPHAVSDVAEVLNMVPLMKQPVKSFPVFADVPGLDGQTVRVPVPSRRLIARHNEETGTVRPYEVASDRYEPLQDIDGFDVLEELRQNRDLVYETAGTLNDGAITWILASLSRDPLDICGDLVKPYVAVLNRHDAKGSRIFAPVSTRIECENTFAHAMSEARHGINLKQRHTGDADVKVDELRDLLGMVDQEFVEFQAQALHLAGIQMSTRAVGEYFSAVLPDKEGQNNDRRAKVRGQLQELFEAGAGNAQRRIRGSAWAAWNAVTEYVDHYRSINAEPQKRLYSATFASGQTMKRQALRVALTLN